MPTGSTGAGCGPRTGSGAPTDRGVFSLQAEAILNASRGFRALAGRAMAIEAGERQVVVTIEYGDERERVAYDLVVVAIGFQARWFEGLLGEQARHRLDRGLAGDDLERRIDPDLSVAGLNPPLHLPVVAGLAQGPGFPNLSCLGLLSDRILRRYVPRATDAAEAATAEAAADATEAVGAAGTSDASMAADTPGPSVRIARD